MFSVMGYQNPRHCAIADHSVLVTVLFLLIFLLVGIDAFVL